MATQAVGELPRVKLWDWPVRVVHWAFVLLLPALWWTVENHDLETHKQLGMVMVILVAFRLLWGLVGSSTARFSGFVRGPVAVMRYVRSLFGGPAGEPVVGHNPLGGWSVVLLLGLLTWQVGMGLIAQDTDGLESGPLNYLVDYDTAEWAREMHELGFNVILGVIAIHVLAILYYLTIRRDNLVTPMISGSARLSAGANPPRMAHWWLAPICLVIAWAFGGWIWAGAPLPW
jgi:cytochrome b